MFRKRFVAFILAATVTFAIAALGGCGGKSNSQTPANTLSPGDGTGYAGVHIVNKTATNEFLIRDGRSDYALLVPAKYGKTALLAINELRQYIAEATGCSLSLVEDSEDLPNGKYISLGDTSLFRKSGIEADGELLGDNGYRLVTKDGNIFIVATAEYGILNGAYELLKQTVDFRVFAVDEVQYSTKREVTLYNYDITEVPDFQWRMVNVDRIVDGDETYRMRLRLNSMYDIFLPTKAVWHNGFFYIRPEEHRGKEYDKWFASTDPNNRRQLCYTAHGDEIELNKMVELIATEIATLALTNDQKTATVMHEDNHDWCTCGTCSALKQRYGTDSVSALQFCNLVSRKVQSILAENGSDKQVNIGFFAYLATEDAPVKMNAAGEYVPIDEGALCDDNVFVVYAPISAKYTQPFESSDNKQYAETMEKWNVVSKQMFAFFYQTDYNHYLLPYNSHGTLADRYRFALERNTTYMYDLPQWNQEQATAFNRFQTWVSSELLWNVNLDFNALLDEYMEGYFHAASGPMHKLYDEMFAHMTYNETHMGLDGGVYFDMNQAKFFPKPVLSGWMDYINEAYQAIEQYNVPETRELYTRLKDRINLESISIRYALIAFYPGTYSAATLLNMQQAFYDDCTALGVTQRAELKPIEELWQEWKLY